MMQKIKKYIWRTVLGLAGFLFILSLLVIVFRSKIERYAISQLDQFFKVPVYIHDVEFTFWKTFPNFSLRLDGVVIQDYSEEFGKLPDTLLYAKQIDLKANTWYLLQADMSIESIVVRDALVGLRIDANGKENYDIFVKDSVQTESNFDLNLKKVNFINTEFRYANTLTEQAYAIWLDRLRFSGRFKNESFDMHVQANAKLKKFKDKSVTLLRDLDVDIETDVFVNSASKRYEILNSILLINEMPFELSLLLDAGHMDLKLQGKDISLVEVMTAIHQDNLEKLKSIETSGSVQFSLHVNGDIDKSNTPDIDAEFRIKNGLVKDPNQALEIKKIELQGKYEKHQGKPEKLELSQLSLQTMGQHFNGRLSVSDFSQPDIRLQGNGGINLAALHHFFPLPQVRSISGNVTVNGMIHAILSAPSTPNQHLQIINSQVDFECKDIAIESTLDFPKIQKISGRVSTRNDDFVFNRFQLRTARSSAEISGNVKNVILFLEKTGNLQVDGALKAEKIDLDEFMGTQANEDFPVSYPVGVFVLPKSIHGVLDFDVDNFVVNNHHFSSILGSMLLSDRQIEVRHLKLTHLGSQAAGNLRIFERIAGTIELIGEMNTTGLNLKQVFAEWNNFEQETIRAENINGKADLALKFHFPFSMNKGIVKEQINAQASLKISGGSLVQVAALQEIAKSMRSNALVKVFLGKNLDAIEKKLSNLTFETLENTFYIANSKFVIPKMKIKTNVMDLVVYGWQHFDESLEYHFEFDFRDLKQKNKDSEFGNAVDDGVATRLFLKMFGTLSNLQFAWDSDARKQFKKEQREQETQELKNMFKSEFGMFKKDSTVQRYQPSTKPQEVIEIDFGEGEENVDVEQKKKRIDENYKRIKKKNSTKTEEVIIEFE
jgi:hypothetical protein